MIKTESKRRYNPEGRGPISYPRCFTPYITINCNPTVMIVLAKIYDWNRTIIVYESDKMGNADMKESKARKKGREKGRKKGQIKWMDGWLNGKERNKWRNKLIKMKCIFNKQRFQTYSIFSWTISSFKNAISIKKKGAT